jgi:hypothetical protein
MDKERIVVGEIENLANFGHRLLPIRSFRQLVSVVVAAGFISLGFFALFRELPPGPVVVGMLLGMHPFLAGALPTSFRIKVAGNLLLKRELLERLKGAAFRFGYKNQTMVDGIMIMKPKLPKFLVWNENTLRLEERGDAIVVCGPLVATSMLRRKILKRRQEAT